MGIVPLKYLNPQRNPLKMAIDALRANGHHVETAQVPGILFLDGKEVTISQLIQISGIALKP